MSTSIHQDSADVLNEDDNPAWIGGASDPGLEARLQITTERLSHAPISRHIFGNFIESGFARQISGMWAEMLYNRSFQEIPLYKGPTWGWLQIDSGHYNKDAPFWHSGYEEYDWELIAPQHSRRWRTHGADTFKGPGSLVLSNDTEGEYAGIKQRGIYLQAGEAYTFSIFGGFAVGWGQKLSPSLNGFDQIDDRALETRTVRITLKEEGNDQGVLFSRTLEFRCIQQMFELDIVLPNFTGRAVLEIAFEWEGRLLLSWCSLTPKNNVEGWRADVVDLLKEISPPVIRFPGGCFTSFFDWRDAVGPREQRAAMESYYWGGLDENDVGIDEYLDLCHEIGAEPQVCINMMTSTPFEAAELVEYCNGPDESHMGRWRRENGVIRHSKVVLWEMDNEPGRKWSALQYARQVVKFAEAMRGVDPDIKLMMAYYGFQEGMEWLPQMLEIAGHHIDFVIHREKSKTFIERALSIIREYNQRNGRDIRQVNTEWLANFNAPEPFDDPEIPQNYRWQGGQTINDYRKIISFRQVHWFYALNVACHLLDYMSLGGEFYLANFNNCVNTWGQNVIESAKEGAWLSPAGHVFKFFSNFKGKYPLKTELAEGRSTFIKAQACETGDGKIHVYLVNVGRNTLPVSFDLPADYTVESVETLSAPDRLSRCYLHTNEIQLDAHELNDRRWTRIKPLSVNRIACSM